MNIVLASASPRREELLRRIVDSFDVVPSGVEETTRGRPARRVLESARSKARDVASRTEGIVIGADTVVVVRRSILGKPSSRDEAGQMLSRLSGREHEVLTGLCIIATQRGDERSAVERTSVRFRSLSEREIASYLDCGEYADKAGAYAIQGRASVFVERICGDYTNVMGLPVCRLTLLLRELGVDV